MRSAAGTDHAPADLRRTLAREGVRPACESCGWSLPEGLGASAVTAHHAIPLAAGGGDVEDNLVLLCPNHHAIAHRLWPLVGKKSAARKGYDGPRSPAEVVEELRLFDADPEAYRVNRLRLFAAGREEALAAMRRVLPGYVPPWER